MRIFQNCTFEITNGRARQGTFTELFCKTEPLQTTFGWFHRLGECYCLWKQSMQCYCRHFSFDWQKDFASFPQAGVFFASFDLLSVTGVCTDQTPTAPGSSSLCLGQNRRAWRESTVTAYRTQRKRERVKEQTAPDTQTDIKRYGNNYFWNVFNLLLFFLQTPLIPRPSMARRIGGGKTSTAPPELETANDQVLGQDQHIGRQLPKPWSQDRYHNHVSSLIRGLNLQVRHQQQYQQNWV